MTCYNTLTCVIIFLHVRSMPRAASFVLIGTNNEPARSGRSATLPVQSFVCVSLLHACTEMACQLQRAVSVTCALHNMSHHLRMLIQPYFIKHAESGLSAVTFSS